ncbi:MAG: integration host factor subunit beta [Deltaproteobacteria bacterium]|nr:integration host factor subunit beta [Deltaproteobacteria bacterium]
MNRSELINAITDKLNLPQREVALAVNSLLEMIIEALEKGDRVEIRGFGSFTVRKYGAYTGRNPKTGKPVSVKPKRLPYFKVGKEFKEMVNV